MKKLSPQVREFTAVFEPAPEGGYVVSVPLLPGCYSQGETFEEAKTMIQEAIELHLEELAEEGHPALEETQAPIFTRVRAHLAV